MVIGGPPVSIWGQMGVKFDFFFSNVSTVTFSDYSGYRVIVISFKGLADPMGSARLTALTKLSLQPSHTLDCFTMQRDMLLLHPCWSGT